MRQEAHRNVRMHLPLSPKHLPYSVAYQVCNNTALEHMLAWHTPARRSHSFPINNTPPPLPRNTTTRQPRVLQGRSRPRSRPVAVRVVLLLVVLAAVAAVTARWLHSGRQSRGIPVQYVLVIDSGSSGTRM